MEAQTATDSGSACGCFGDWRSPERSQTSYVRCLLESVHYMLRARGVTVADCKLVAVALRAQFVQFIRHDLRQVLPDENGAVLLFWVIVPRTACALRAESEYGGCMFSPQNTISAHPFHGSENHPYPEFWGPGTAHALSRWHARS